MPELTLTTALISAVLALTAALGTVWRAYQKALQQRNDLADLMNQHTELIIQALASERLAKHSGSDSREKSYPLR